MLLPHFSRSVLYRWLYGLWKSDITILLSFSRTVNARLQQTTAHSESRLTRGRESTHRLVVLSCSHVVDVLPSVICTSSSKSVTSGCDTRRPVARGGERGRRPPMK